MKTTILILLLTAAAAFAQTSQICVTIAPADKQRVSQAFGSILGLTNPGGQVRPATDEEMSQALAVWMGSQTQDYERRQNQQNYKPPPFDPNSGGGYMNGQPTATPAKAAPSPPAKKK